MWFNLLDVIHTFILVLYISHLASRAHSALSFLQIFSLREEQKDPEPSITQHLSGRSRLAGMAGMAGIAGIETFKWSCVFVLGNNAAFRNGEFSEIGQEVLRYPKIAEPIF